MKCPHCFKRISPVHMTGKKPNFSKDDFYKLKAGSIMISAGGALRKVERTYNESHYVTFQNLQDPLKKTSYLYTDLYWSYKIKKI